MAQPSLVKIVEWRGEERNLLLLARSFALQSTLGPNLNIIRKTSDVEAKLIATDLASICCDDDEFTMKSEGLDQQRRMWA